MTDKVVIGYIHGSMIENAFMQSLWNLLTTDAGSRRKISGVIPFQGAYLDDNRNEVVRDFLTRDARWLLFLDTDHKFTPDQIYALIDEAERNDRAILSALYFGFVADGHLRPVWFTSLDSSDGGARTIGNFTTGEIIPLGACGMGCCLIRRDVFEAMQAVPEWGNDSWTWFGRDAYVNKGKPYHYGEDICFCYRAAKIGFQTWGHSGLVIGHIKRQNLDFEAFRAYLAKTPNFGKATRTGAFGIKE